MTNKMLPFVVVAASLMACGGNDPDALPASYESGIFNSEPSRDDTVEANGLSLNGLSLNGLSLNGLSLNGLSLNGLSLNGLSLNGLSLNGLSLNGLSLNGLSLNGLPFNGLSFNGLSFNGLSSTDFTSWFSGNPTNNDLLMRYMVRCAVPAGETRSYRNPITGVLYTWPGSLGLAPGWASGAPASLEEQQTLSACLAISVLGRDTNDVAIPSAEGLLGFSRRESCLFGNVFTNEGLFVGDDHPSLTDEESTPRPCGLKGLSDSACPVVKRIGQCERFCTVSPNGTDYEQCSYNGVRYTPLNTRMFGSSSP